MNQVIDGNVLTNQMINTQNDENAKNIQHIKSPHLKYINDIIMIGHIFFVKLRRL